MYQTTACQSGWLAVFEDASEPNGYFTEPVACWVTSDDGNEPYVRPVCALGGDVCDASLAENYLGVVGPGGDIAKFMHSVHAARDVAERNVS